MAAVDSLVNGISNLQVNSSHIDGHKSDDRTDEFSLQWGFPLEDLYKIALKFFKEKEGKALQLTYKDKLRLVAYTKQVLHGKFRSDAVPDVGFLDVVGNDRSTDPEEWQAWQILGNMPKETAMTEFVEQLDAMCPLFRPYVQAHKTEKEEKLRKQQEEEALHRKEEEEKHMLEAEDAARKQQEAERQRQHEQELQIRAALNQQTAHQFRQYSQQQYPGNSQMQEELIRQLQEQHYQQYMQQVYQQQLLHQQQQFQQLQNTYKNQGASSNSAQGSNGSFCPATNGSSAGDGGTEGQGDEDGEVGDSAAGEEDDLPPIAAASMWTRKDIKDFKDSLRRDKDSVIKIGSGETVTVRVPTHEDGTCLFWEFATDSYDIGFGVYFEWTIAPSNTVSVHISESSDEEEQEESDAGETKGDVEKGGKSQENKPPTDEIIPVYRRDCHEEVYCGSHVYPGRGVYLLKFDNSYSLWRSKTLYYRVYYSR
ncbi:Golgi resident protein GCP60-like isoform X2 [Pomacea canaliculata]|uniref:Golgi resident protein GCP60-like isoform X2 n=1 Tax=Pomacea canaliculata TaxID=400727 RepID=UPI000D73EEFB|nr:Golgi resident protein GCP60-like isoform X2 [Pomacea canaliculata]